jgi:acyl carrier protein
MTAPAVSEEGVVAAPIIEITAILRVVLRDPELELTPTTHFDDMPGWEAMDMVALVVEVECRFDVQFELPEIDRLTTVGDLLRMITAKQARAAA